MQKYNTLCQMNSKRNLQLERAQSLASQFWETYEEIWPWLTETQTVISQLPAPALEYETLKQQQEEHRVSLQLSNKMLLIPKVKRSAVLSLACHIHQTNQYLSDFTYFLLSVKNNNPKFILLWNKHFLF